MNPEIFAEELANYGFKLSSKQKEQFATYYNKLIEFNKKVNLTRITDKNEVYLKHFFDSITPLLEFSDLFKGEKSLCDVGAGAGFPSLPIKILCPDLSITIVDSLGKRLKFLDELVSDLSLDKVTLVHSRAEDAGQNKNLREKFDLVTGRAVARMSVLSEYCLPLAKVDGYLVALKGPKAQDELAEAKNAIEVLGGSVKEVKELTLPDTDDERTLIVVKQSKSYAKEVSTSGWHTE